MKHQFVKLIIRTFITSYDTNVCKCDVVHHDLFPIRLEIRVETFDISREEKLKIASFKTHSRE